MSEEEIFHEVLARSPTQRAEYLDQSCAGNPDLRAAVEGLLRANVGASGFLDGPALGATVDLSTVVEHPGTMIGPYKLLEQIGEGGFGVVYMAEQEHPVCRRVALKVLKPGMDTRQVVARFEAERQALALMDHPNIAKIHDGGTTLSGRPYFVMELVRGIPITDYCDQTQLAVRARLELFVRVCQAVQHAHTKGVIHRDLKPSNVLVTLHDGAPVPKVIDFGVAKALGQRLTDKTLFTAFAQIIGTPLYMSPEQAELSGLNVDTRSDVYSLGVLLYELLTGTTPFDGDRLKTAGYDEMRRIIREEEPLRPSSRVSTLGQAASTVSANRRSDPRRLSKSLRGELDWVVMKCLEKDRTRRYETVDALAKDVVRYLSDDPVQACPPSPAYRMRKFVRRNRARVLMAAIALLAVLLAGGSWSWLTMREAARVTAAEDLADKALTEAEQRVRAGDYAEAKALLTRAEGLLESSGGGALLQARGRRLRADLTMAARLDEIRILKSETKDEHFDTPQADLNYAVAFREFGIDVITLEPAEAASRIRERSIADVLAISLDDWADICRQTRNRDDSTWRHLLAVARLADPHSTRDELRVAIVRDPTDRSRLVEAAAPDRISGMPAPTLVLLAAYLRRTGAIDRAVSVLRQAQEQHADDFWSNHELGMMLTKQRPPQLNEAIRFLTAAVALRPQSPGARLNLASALHGAGLSEQALAMYATVLQLKPDDAMAWYNRGNTYAALDKLEAAVADYTRALELRPEYVQALSNRGLTLSKLGQYEQAEADLSRAIELTPDLALAWNHRGLARFRALRYEDAYADLSKAIELKPNSAEVWTTRGVVQLKLGRHAQAIADHDRAIEIDPGFAEAWCNRGNVHASRRRYREAVADYTKSVELKPDLVEARNNRGLALIHLGENQRAITDFNRSIEVDPRHAESWSGRALAYSNLREFVKAIADYTKAIELKPDDVSAWSNRGNVHRRANQLEKAIADYTKAIELNPRHPTLWSNRGMVYTENGEFDKAVADFSKVIELKPDYPSVWASRANAHHAAGRREMAIADLSRAIDLNPADTRAWLGRARTYARGGQFDLAMSDYSEVIKREPQQWLNRVERARLYVALRQWDSACADFAYASKLIPDDLEVAFEYAGAQLLSGDREGFKQLCAHVNERGDRLQCLNDPGRRSYLIARTCLLAPRAGADAAGPERLAAEAVKAEPKFAWHLHTLGLAHYRAGRHDEAVKQFDASMQADSAWPGQPVNWLALAMAHQQLGHRETAQKWFDKAVRAVDQVRDKPAPAKLTGHGMHSHDWLAWLLLRREAEELLKGNRK